MKRLLTLTTALAGWALATPAAAQLAPPNAAGITYGHVHISVADVELHKKLWVEHFGGVVVQKGPLTAIKLPNMLIALRPTAPTGPSRGTVMDHFGFKVQNLAEVLQKWRAAGYEVTREFTGAEGFPNAYLTGPDNIYVELQEDRTLPVKVAGYHIHFLHPEYVKIRDWYVDMFSLAPRKRGSIDTTADAPGMNLSFGTAEKPTAPTRGRTIDHIGFEIDNLEAFCKKLEARGIKFDTPFRDAAAVSLKIAYLTDPWGTYIELTEGYDQY
jgi:catechol 2,3-dioxygenase-like lactoylglutathione lyase family enzyme